MENYHNPDEMEENAYTEFMREKNKKGNPQPKANFGDMAMAPVLLVAIAAAVWLVIKIVGWLAH